MVDDILVYDEQTHVSMEITLQKKEEYRILKQTAPRIALANFS